MHHQPSDRLIVAKLHGAVSRHAGWTRPEGDARDAAVAELRGIATVSEEPKHGSLHQPRAEVRTDLLAETAGILIGFAPDDHPEHHQIAADLLRDAGADEATIQEWIPVGRKRREGGGPAFSKAEAPPKQWP
ncbi:MAG TPA: hypothetical protein VIP77_23220 [Jiangellaceae bacterium]